MRRATNEDIDLNQNNTLSHTNSTQALAATVNNSSNSSSASNVSTTQTNVNSTAVNLTQANLSNTFNQKLQENNKFPLDSTAKNFNATNQNSHKKGDIHRVSTNEAKKKHVPQRRGFSKKKGKRDVLEGSAAGLQLKC